MPRVLKARDITDVFVTEKDILPNIAFRFILCGASGQGKSSVLSCMVCLPDWYGNDFIGANIYIWSGSKGDDKINRMVDFKEVPESNIRHDWFDSEVSGLYENLLQDWRDAVDDKKKPENILFIVDDMFFSNKFRSEASKNSMMSKIYQNGRKFNISIVILAQKYSSISTNIRENANAIITFSATNKQMELMEADWNYLENKKQFYDLFRKATENKFDFLFINIDRPLKDRYMDKDFNSIVVEK